MSETRRWTFDVIKTWPGLQACPVELANDKLSHLSDQRNLEIEAKQREPDEIPVAPMELFTESTSAETERQLDLRLAGWYDIVSEQGRSHEATMEIMFSFYPAASKSNPAERFGTINMALITLRKQLQMRNLLAAPSTNNQSVDVARRWSQLNSVDEFMYLSLHIMSMLERARQITDPRAKIYVPELGSRVFEPVDGEFTDQQKFLEGAAEMLNGVRAFWDGLEKRRLELEAVPA